MRKPRRLFSIRLKVLGSTLAILLPISLFMFSYYPSRTRREALAELRHRTENMAELVAIGVEGGIRRDDLSVVMIAVNWARKDPALAYVMVVDTAGEVFAGHNPSGIDLDVSRESQRVEVAEVAGLLRTAVPIGRKGRPDGTLLLGLSLELLENRLEEDRLLALCISAGVFLLGGALAILFAERIAGPVVRLWAAANAVAQGDYEVVAEAGGSDEIGDLGEAFNSMVDNLRSSRARLGEMVGQLQDARDVAVAAARAKADFLATMSHEIRTPMNGVLGMLDLLLDSELTAEQQDRARTAYRSAEALLRIINDILDFSKVEAGKLSLEAIDFDLRTTLEEITSLLGERAFSRGLDVVALVRPGVPAAVRGDPGRLRQVLVNLAGNAIKFTEAGDIILRARLEEEADGEILIRFEVSDTGIGMTPEVQGRLFTAFSQADASTTRKYGGTGLGLAICKQLVELMGGEIGVRSEVGEGSTFWFTARFARAQAAAINSLPRHETVTGLRVLVVDDHRASRSVLIHHLAAWEMEGHAAENGVRGLEMLRAATAEGKPFDVAIVDFQIPGMDGLAVAQAIKADPAIAATRLILLTSMALPGHANEAHSAGFAAFLAKPIRQSPLHDCIATVMASGVTSPGASPAQERIITRHTLAEARSASRSRILLAEDNEVNQQVAVGLLEKLGHRVDIAPNGAEAVAALASVRYDLVLMDCQMPEMDGFEATRAIRSRETAERRLPIVAMTANAGAGDREQCLAAGMDDYLSKPMNRGKLEAVLRQWLPAGPSEAARLPGKGVVVAAEPESPAVDLSQLRSIVGDDRATLRRYLSLFVSSSEPLLSDLGVAVRDRDASRVRGLAHILRGASGNVGARDVARVSAEMEHAASNGEWDGLASLHARLQTSFDQAGAFARSV